jgi:hypothetical protein
LARQIQILNSIAGQDFGVDMPVFFMSFGSCSAVDASGMAPPSVPAKF